MSDAGFSSEEAPHTPAHKVCQDRYDNRHADHRARLCPQNDVSDVTQHIDDKQSQRETVSPPIATPQATRCQRTTHTDSAHQNNSRNAHTCEGFARSRVEPPHRFKKTSWKKERDENREARESTQREEDAEKCDTDRTSFRVGHRLLWADATFTMLLSTIHQHY